MSIPLSGIDGLDLDFLAVLGSGNQKQPW